jgi:AcrR family transcriptional regulator
MSAGNLSYHYANVDVIVEALYFRLVEELDTLILGSMQLARTQGIDIHFIYHSIEDTFAIFQRYKFLMLDFADIMRRHERLKQHFRELAKVRQAQFLPILSALQAGGWLEKERYPGQLQDWTQQASVIGDYWMASAEIMLDGDSDYKRKHYVRLFFATLAPHLTPRGLEVYQQILADS